MTDANFDPEACYISNFIKTRTFTDFTKNTFP